MGEVGERNNCKPDLDVGSINAQDLNNVVREVDFLDLGQLVAAERAVSLQQKFCLFFYQLICGFSKLRVVQSSQGRICSKCITKSFVQSIRIRGTKREGREDRRLSKKALKTIVVKKGIW